MPQAVLTLANFFLLLLLHDYGNIVASAQSVLLGEGICNRNRGTNSLGTSYWSAHHSTPLTTYLGFPDFNIPTECSIFPEALRGEQMSAEPPKNSCFVSLPVVCCFWGTMIRVFAHTFN